VAIRDVSKLTFQLFKKEFSFFKQFCKKPQRKSLRALDFALLVRMNPVLLKVKEYNDLIKDDVVLMSVMGTEGSLNERNSEHAMGMILNNLSFHRPNPERPLFAAIQDYCALTPELFEQECANFDVFCKDPSKHFLRALDLVVMIQRHGAVLLNERYYKRARRNKVLFKCLGLQDDSSSSDSSDL